MPQRTNKYQKLVLYISKQLASDTSVIYESRMLWDSHSEQNREVDIVIEQNADIYTLLIGVECTAKNRKLGIKEIEQLHQKHKNLNINKTVIVSDSGFVSKGHTYAKKNNIELVEFKESLQIKWPELWGDMGRLSANYFSFRCLSLEVEIQNKPVEALSEADKLFVESDRFGKCEIHEFVRRYALMTPWGDTNGKEKTEMKLWKFNPALVIVNEHEVKFYCVSMTVNYAYIKANLGLKYNKFREKSIAHGIAEVEGEFAHVGVTMSPTDNLNSDGKPTFSVTIHADSNK